MDISNRIQELIRKNQLNAAKFADRIGVQRSNLSHVLTGRNKPGLDFIEKVLLEFPNVDANWLISGNAKHKQQLEEVSKSENSSLRTDDATDLSGNAHKQIQSRTLNATKETTKVDKIIVFYNDNTFEEFKK